MKKAAAPSKPRSNAGLEAAMDGGDVRVTVSGEWSVLNHPPDVGSALSLLEKNDASSLTFVAGELAHWDTSLVVALAQLSRAAKKRDLAIHFDASMPGGVSSLLELALAAPDEDPKKKKRNNSFLENVGEWASAIPQKALDVLDFIGEITLSFGRLFRGKAICTKRDVWMCIQDTSANALPIVALISLLVGLILAFVGVMQLRMFRAEIYVSSLVAIGMTRIMGAIMTGIVLAGRTGASYAATIGSMQVNEEVDALTSLGIPPTDYLVLPRMIALATMTPLLVLYADFMGIVGGFLVGSLALGIDPIEYLNFTQRSLRFSHLFVGVIHGFAFGIVVAIAGCYQGLRCERSAAGVGVATTSAVVNAIVFIIIVTAILTLVFNVVNI